MLHHHSRTWYWGSCTRNLKSSFQRGWWLFSLTWLRKMTLSRTYSLQAGCAHQQFADGRRPGRRTLVACCTGMFRCSHVTRFARHQHGFPYKSLPASSLLPLSCRATSPRASRSQALEVPGRCSLLLCQQQFLSAAQFHSCVCAVQQWMGRSAACTSCSSVESQQQPPRTICRCIECPEPCADAFSAASCSVGP